MKKILIGAMALVLGLEGIAVGRTQGGVVAGPLRYESNNHCQNETPFYVERVRVGDYAWFPSPIIIGSEAGEEDLRPFVGKDVLVFGEYTRIPITSPQPTERDSVSALAARRILPVENRQRKVFTIVELPGELDEEETSIKFTVKNPLPCELDAARILVDLEGHFRFEDGIRSQYTTHHKQMDPVFKANEEREYLLPLVPSDLEREKGHFAASIMYWGYYVKDDVIIPVYAFWRKRW